MNARSSSAENESFAVNWRFYTQALTGVQRYAREITRAMDDALLTSAGSAVILAPPGSGDAVPPFKAMTVREVGPGRGHAWEQAVLPFRSPGRLLNLCNTAPALPIQQVVCIHDANVFEQPESYSWAFRSYYRMLQPWIARRALRVATVSTKAADDLMRCLGVPAKALVVLPNGHEHVFRWRADRSSIMGRLAGTRPYVFVLGSRARHKNIGMILNLAGDIDALGLDIVVAGEGASIFTKTVTVARPNVHTLGRVSDDDLAVLLSNALCLAFPSLTEGFGIPVVEAMALGCRRTRSGSRSTPTPPCWPIPPSRRRGGSSSPDLPCRRACARTCARRATAR